MYGTMGMSQEVESRLLPEVLQCLFNHILFHRALGAPCSPHPPPQKKIFSLHLLFIPNLLFQATHVNRCCLFVLLSICFLTLLCAKAEW